MTAGDKERGAIDDEDVNVLRVRLGLLEQITHYTVDDGLALHAGSFSSAVRTLALFQGLENTRRPRCTGTTSTLLQHA